MNAHAQAETALIQNGEEFSLLHKGIVYEATLSVITEVFLGFGHHQILTAYLSFEGRGWGQAEPAMIRSDEALGLYVKEVLKLTQASNWSDVKGKNVLTLRKNITGQILGMASEDGSRVLMFEDVNF